MSTIAFTGRTTEGNKVVSAFSKSQCFWKDLNHSTLSSTPTTCYERGWSCSPSLIPLSLLFWISLLFSFCDFFLAFGGGGGFGFLFQEFWGSPCPKSKENRKRKNREWKISPKFFRPKFFRGRPRGMSVPKCLFFFQDLEGLTEVFGRMSAGTSGRKLRSLGWFFVSEKSKEIQKSKERGIRVGGPKSHNRNRQQFRVDGAKSPDILQKEWVSGSEIAARNRKSPATFHLTLKSQCSVALSSLGNIASDVLGSAMGVAIANHKNHSDFGALPWSPFPCFFWISLLFSFCDFPCLPRRVTPKILGKESNNAPKKHGRIAKAKNKEIQTKQGKGDQGKFFPSGPVFRRCSWRI